MPEEKQDGRRNRRKRKAADAEGKAEETTEEGPGTPAATQEPAVAAAAEPAEEWKHGETRTQHIIKNGKRYPVKVQRASHPVETAQPVDYSKLPVADEGEQIPK